MKTLGNHMGEQVQKFQTFYLTESAADPGLQEERMTGPQVQADQQKRMLRIGSVSSLLSKFCKMNHE